MTLAADPPGTGSIQKLRRNQIPRRQLAPRAAIADSQCHVPPGLERLMAALEQPGVGLVTTLYVGLPLLPITLRAGSVLCRSPTASCQALCCPVCYWDVRTA